MDQHPGMLLFNRSQSPRVRRRNEFRMGSLLCSIRSSMSHTDLTRADANPGSHAENLACPSYIFNWDLYKLHDNFRTSPYLMVNGKGGHIPLSGIYSGIIILCIKGGGILGFDSEWNSFSSPHLSIHIFTSIIMFTDLAYCLRVRVPSRPLLRFLDEDIMVVLELVGLKNVSPNEISKFVVIK